MSKFAIPPETAQHVLYMFGHTGRPPGPFAQQLLQLIAHADRQNLAKLAEVFPAEAEAVRLAQREHGGIDILRRYAEGRAVA